MISIIPFEKDKHLQAKQTFSFTDETFDEYNKQENALYLACENEEIVGCIGFNITSGEILDLEVIPQYRKKGIGRKLLKSIHDRVLSPVIKVQATSQNAPFFEKCHFTCDEDYQCFHIMMGRKCC